MRAFFMRRVVGASVAALCGLLLAADWAAAGSRVRLITLPPRERVAIQLDHAQATLVQEERIVPLVEGTNQVDFAWANTDIDPQTLVFEVLGPADEDVDLEATVLSRSHPPDEDAVVWEVSATASGPALVRISYLMGGLDKGFNYRAVASADETQLTLWYYVRVHNVSPEQLGESDIHLGLGDVLRRPIGSNETRELLVERYEQVPIEKTFTVHLAKFGYLEEAQRRVRVPMHYVLNNDEEHNLGERPLPAGKARIFAEDGRGSTAFLGEDVGEYTPINEAMRLYLGLAQDVAVKRRITGREPERVTGNLHHYDLTVRYEIENFRDEPTHLDIVEDIEKLRQEAGIHSDRPSQWQILDNTTFEEPPDAERTDHSQLVYRVELPPREADEADEVVHELHLRFANEWGVDVRPLR